MIHTSGHRRTVASLARSVASLARTVASLTRTVTSLARTVASLARTVPKPSRPRPYLSLRGPAQPFHDEREARVSFGDGIFEKGNSLQIVDRFLFQII